MNLGAPEIFWIVLVVLLLFGAKRIPEMMRSLGQGVKEFKKAAKDITSDDDSTSSPKSTSSSGQPKSQA